MDERAPRHRWPLLLALGLALYTGFLLMTAPAAMVAWALKQVTRDAMSLEGAQGGLWQGRADALVVTRPGAAALRFRGLQWEVLPSRLLLGRLGAVLKLDDERLRGATTIEWRPHSLRVADAAFTLSARALAVFFSAAQLARPGGELKARAGTLTFEEGAVGGQAEIEWTDASSALSPVNPLGTYRAKMTGDGAGAKIEVTTLQGSLQIEGSGAWSPKLGPLFSGTARAQPARAAELRELLRLLGPEDQNGVFRLRWGAT